MFAQFCAAQLASQSEAWLSVDLTLPQIRAVFLIVTLGRATGSRLARALGIGLPSTTRLADRLVEHGLVVREEDPADRRVSYIVPTPAAERLVERVESYRREYLAASLAALDLDQLCEVRQGFTHLVAVCPAGEAEAADVAKEPVRG